MKHVRDVLVELWPKLETPRDRQTLRVSMTRDDHGQPESLVLAAGFGGAETGRGFHRPNYLPEPLVLPASALPELRAALDALEGE